MKSGNKNKQKGFTMIELLVVFSVIALISSVIFSITNVARTKARDLKRVADVKQLINALSLDYDKNGHYPCHSMSFGNAFDNTTGLVNGTQYPYFLTKLQTDGFIATGFKIKDPTNVDPLIYGYGSYNSQKLTAAERSGGTETPAHQATCGGGAYLFFSTEKPISACPGSGVQSSGQTHCHIYLPTGLPPVDATCDTTDANSTTCVYVDSYSEYNP